MVSTALTLASNGQYNLTVPKSVVSSLGLAPSQLLSVVPVCTTERRPGLTFSTVPESSPKQSHHRALNSQAKAAGEEAGRQLVVRLPSQLARAMLLTGGETFEWGEPAEDSIEATIVGGQEYDELDVDEPSVSETGATEATLKAYGESEQFRTYLPRLSVTRWDGKLPNGLPSHASFRIECRNGELCVVLDGDHDDAVLENGEVREPDELPGYPISLQSSANRSQITLNFPKQIAHALSLKQEEQPDGPGEKTIEVTVIRWSVDQLNPRRLLGRFTRETRDE